jgi:hypothetical protein
VSTLLMMLWKFLQFLLKYSDEFNVKMTVYHSSSSSSTLLPILYDLIPKRWKNFLVELLNRTSGETTLRLRPNPRDRTDRTKVL